MSDFTDAVVAAVTADRDPAPRIYVLGHVPASPKYPYSVASVVRDRPLGYTLEATHGPRDYRISLQHFGASEDAVDAYAAAADDRLVDKRLTVAGYTCGPIRHQLTTPVMRDPDDEGVLGITSALMFTATKEPA